MCYNRPIKMFHDTIVGMFNIKGCFSGVSSNTIGLVPGCLTPGTEYALRYSIGNKTAAGYAEYSVFTNLPPYGGTCSCSPNKG